MVGAVRRSHTRHQSGSGRSGAAIVFGFEVVISPGAVGPGAADVQGAPNGAPDWALGVVCALGKSCGVADGETAARW